MLQRYAMIAGVIVFLSVGLAAGISDDESTVKDDVVKAAAAVSDDASYGGVGEGGSDVVTIQRDNDSHFYVDADIDGNAFRMVIDSGATSVVIPRNMAEAAGIDVDELPVGGSARTAGGIVEVRPITFSEISIEGLTVRNVDGAIIDTEMESGLLGQSFLNELEEVKVEGGRMTLR